ncbi:MAG: hypothetical protein WC777_04755 [Candidatus Gracilibacteria bacterium]|jgi:hypothetical protein
MPTLSETPLSPEIQDGISKIHASLDQAEADLAIVTDEQTPQEQRTAILQRYSALIGQTRIGWQNVPEETFRMLIRSVPMDHPDWENAWQRDRKVSREWLKLFETSLNVDVKDYQEWVKLKLRVLA